MSFALVLVFLLAWPGVTHSNWMLSDNNRLCRFECIMTRGQSIHKCMTTEQIVDRCDPLAGLNSAVTIVSANGNYCGSDCNYFKHIEGKAKYRCKLYVTNLESDCNKNFTKGTQHLSIYGKYCITECGTSGYSYHWCYVDGDFSLGIHNWDYCAPG